MKKFLTSILLMMMLLCMPLQAHAAGAKAETQRSIAIVFDNSGSMYWDSATNGPNMAWSQATYAMEVFAAMMNPGDSLSIYPMEEITIGGAASYTMDNPLTMAGGDSAAIIKDIFTPGNGDTPIESIERAYEGLAGASGEKWLIVLTDGYKFYRDGTEMTPEVTEQELTDILSKYREDVNVMYLGIGVEAATPDLPEGIYKAAQSSEVPEQLAVMANAIFGRDILQKGSRYFDGTNIYTDIDLSKAFVFIQGTGVSDITLTDESGNRISQAGQEAQLSVDGTGSQAVPSIADETLSGVIATFLDLPAGRYTLSASGEVRDVNVYYEPDVDMEVYMSTDEAGIERIEGDNYPGDYYLHWALVDKDGNPVNSELLGTVVYETSYTQNGQEQSGIMSSPARITLNPGDDLRLSVTAHYLSGYTITKENEDFEWMNSFEVQAFPMGELLIETGDYDDSFLITEFDGVTIPITLSYDGQMLNAEEMERCTVTMDADESDNMIFTLNRTADGWEVQAALADAFTEADCRSYKAELSAGFINEYGEEAVALPVSVSFALEDVAHGLTMEISGGDASILVTKVAESAPYEITPAWDGEVLSAEQLQEFYQSIMVTAEDLSYDLDMDQAEGKLILQLTGSESSSVPEPGEYTIHVQGTLMDELGRPLTADGETKITLNDVEHALTMAITGGNSNILASDIAESTPYEITAEWDGEELSTEQLQEFYNSFTVTVEDLTYDLGVDQADDKLVLQLTGSESSAKAKPGKYTIHMQGTLLDELGRPLTVEGETVIELLRYPVWLPWLIGGIILLILLLLMLFILSRKAFPRKIRVETAKFSADYTVRNNPTDFDCRFTKRFGSKTATLHVESPNIAGAAAAFDFIIEKVDRRWTPSKNRSVLVTSVNVSPNNEATVRVSGNRLKEKEGSYVPDKGETTFTMESGASLSLTARQTMGDEEVDLSMKVSLEFK